MKDYTATKYLIEFEILNLFTALRASSVIINCLVDCN